MQSCIKRYRHDFQDMKIENAKRVLLTPSDIILQNACNHSLASISFLADRYKVVLFDKISSIVFGRVLFELLRQPAKSSPLKTKRFFKNQLSLNPIRLFVNTHFNRII